MTTTLYERQPESLSIRETAKGIAIRAGILSAAGLVVGAWLFSLVAKLASGLVKMIVALILMAVGGGLVMFELKKVRRRHEPDP